MRLLQATTLERPGAEVHSRMNALLHLGDPNGVLAVIELFVMATVLVALLALHVWVLRAFSADKLTADHPVAPDRDDIGEMRARRRRRQRG